ncbi:MAG: hypothetical protein JXB49_03000 [Bacteroidales bacterium]|nr:hypothetical protein [Bacteroidales bacterium]
MKRNLRICRCLYLPSMYLVFLLIAQSFSGSLSAQDVTLKVSTNKDTILIGDHVELLLQVDKANEYDVWFPILTDTITEHIDVISVEPIDTLQGDDGRSKLTQKYIITSFDSGIFEIPPLPFAISGKGEVDTIHSSEIQLVVNTLPVSLEDPIKDIKDIYKVPLTFRELLPYILILLGAAMLVIVTIYVIKKIKAKEPIIPRIEKPKTPPEIIAIRDLDSLKAKKLWQQGRVKEYYSILTDIIRIYIEDRFYIMAMEQTSDEILLQFEKTEYGTQEEYSILKRMFTTADLVKFAKGDPLADENELHLANAYVFVEKTTPVKEVEELDMKEENQNE